MPVVPGYEVAGRVDAVGAEVETDWIGREVLAMCRFGGYSEAVCVPEIQTFARPEGLTMQQAAAFPVNYVTAYQLMVVMGSLKPGETVLVHSAGGGVGVAAIQIAARLGARVIGTASAAKHDYLKGLGVEACIDYTREDFETRVRELTGGRGVELALDAVGGKSFRKSYRALAPTGRLGMFGMSAASPGKVRNLFAVARAMAQTPWLLFNPPGLMNANKGVFGVNVGHLWEEVDRVREWMETLLGWAVEGVLRPAVDRTFPFERAAEAHHYIQDRKNLGKVLLVP
jgi:NADPH:quinone reductase-like Zn-dependent oxidoreductase